jgi:predicted secreted protein
MTQAPWSDVNIYSNTTQTIKVKTSEELAFGFDTSPRLGLSWDEKHGENFLSLVDSEMILVQPQLFGGKTWYLFKALKTGNTQIPFTYSHGQGSPVNDQKVFNIEIK